MVYRWLRQTHRWLYSPWCLLCSRPSHTPQELCHDCARDLPWNRHACPRCALPLPVESGTQVCGQCLQHPPPWDSALSPLIYAWPLDQLLQRFKFHSDLATGRVLGELLADSLALAPVNQPDVLIPVPLHRTRLCERGFNQALELARPVSRRLQVRLDDRLCVRSKPTAVQSKLDARERAHNLREAFTVRGPLNGMHIALLDDVITTGATMNALSAALRNAGAAHISVWSLARAARLP